MALQGQLVPLVLIPRFTSYIVAGGSGAEFASVALDVSDYASGTLLAGRGPLLGTSATMTVAVEDSEDGQNWFTLDSASMNSSTSEVLDLTALKRRWLRVLVTLGGTDPAVTCWCTGSLERRVA